MPIQGSLVVQEGSIIYVGANPIHFNGSKCVNILNDDNTLVKDENNDVETSNLISR